jgi:conjugative transfer signal peptidase TraF
MKRRTVIIAAAAAGLAMASLALPERRPLIWNITHSVPTGLYWVSDKGNLSVGDRVAIEPTPDVRKLLAERGYLPLGVPLLKRVGASAGQTICRDGYDLTIDGKLAALVRKQDRAGRPMPVWTGCIVLGEDEVFLLNPAQPDSFDSRYFGPLSAENVIGKTHPIWTDERGNGRLVWNAVWRSTSFPTTK